MPSIIPVDQTDIETFTVVTNPIRSYSSGSIQGSTGSVFVFPRRPTGVKDVQPDSSFVESAHDDADLSSLLRSVQQAGKVSRSSSDPAAQTTFAQMLSQYVAAVDRQGQAARLKEALDVVRFTPPVVFNSNTLRKLVVKDQLNAYYRTAYPTAHWAYSNYSTLNFYTASNAPSDSVILYPNIADDSALVEQAGHFPGTYTPSGSFSFDFYVNPRYQQDQPHGAFKAGTILHLSSTFALSLVSGSGVDQNGRTQGFRLQLQLSHSADVAPSLARPGSFPSDLVFLSDDNSLQRNNWHHVVVRWGTSTVNAGTGTFNIDGVDRGTFCVPSGTIAPRLFADPNRGEADVLCLGNFYEGSNNLTSGTLLDYFFAADPATRDGLNVLFASTGISGPSGATFRHPLNAELHDVAIRRCYLSDDAIAASSSRGPTFLDKTYAFYVPPFFVEQSPYRQFVNDHGGLLLTPFEEVDGTTTMPFNVALSFGVGGHYINLENFVKDFAANSFPMLYHLTGVALQGDTDAETCNQFLYEDPNEPYVPKRNLTVLPCDDGGFVPSFQLLASETLVRAVDDLGIEELSFISLDDMVQTSSLLFGGGTFDDGTQPDEQVNAFSALQLGSTPEAPFAAAGPALTGFIRGLTSGSADAETGAPLSVYQRTQDPSSNEVVVFDVSNLFYGFRISPGTLTINDPALSGSGGRIGVTLADDGMGNLYRADCLTPQATWNSVGNVYYDEGLIVVKSPHLMFFGEAYYSMGFRGEQHVHVMKVDALAPNNQLNSSSNPTYQQLAPSGHPNDPEDGFVYVTGISFHDTDMNVVMKASLAQPMLKRPGDKVLFRVKMDF